MWKKTHCNHTVLRAKFCFIYLFKFSFFTSDIFFRSRIRPQRRVEAQSPRRRSWGVDVGRDRRMPTVGGAAATTDGRASAGGRGTRPAAVRTRTYAWEKARDQTLPYDVREFCTGPVPTFPRPWTKYTARPWVKYTASPWVKYTARPFFKNGP